MTRSLPLSVQIKRSHATEYLKWPQRLWNLKNPPLYGPTHSHVGCWSIIKSLTISGEGRQRLLCIQLKTVLNTVYLNTYLNITKNLSRKHGWIRLGATLLRFPLVLRLFCAREFLMSELSLVKFVDGKTFWESPRVLTPYHFANVLIWVR